MQKICNYPYTILERNSWLDLGLGFEWVVLTKPFWSHHSTAALAAFYCPTGWWTLFTASNTISCHLAPSIFLITPSSFLVSALPSECIQGKCVACRPYHLAFYIQTEYLILVLSNQSIIFFRFAVSKALFVKLVMAFFEKCLFFQSLWWIYPFRIFLFLTCSYSCK